MLRPTLVLAVILAAILLATGARSARGAPELPFPEIFGPGLISGPSNNADPAFTPDCRTVFFGRSNGSDYVILYAEASGNGFGSPRLAPFSGTWRDLEGTFAPDGSRFVFASNRPREPDSRRPLDGNWGGKAMPELGGNLWVVERTGSGWSEPRRLPTR